MLSIYMKCIIYSENKIKSIKCLCYCDLCYCVR